MAGYRSFLEYLGEEAKLPPESLASIKDMQERSDRSLLQIVLEQDLLDEELYQKTLAAYFDMPFVGSIRVDDDEFFSTFVQTFPYRFVSRHKIAPIARDENTLNIAVLHPDSIKICREVGFKLNKSIKVCITTESVMNVAIHALYEREDNATDEVNKAFDDNADIQDYQGVNFDEVDDLLDSANEEPIRRLVNSIFYQAVRSNASDIHIDPTPQHTEVRQRIDGVLHKLTEIPKFGHMPLVNRVKVMSNLDISSKNKTQDGRSLVRMGGRKIDIRVSVIPTVNGERVVMRILHQSHGVMQLEQLGMKEKLITALRTVLQHTNGIILITGPTGSGKSTSLYSILQNIDEKTKNIITIEDPVEYQIPGYGQVQVNPKVGLTFASGLRSLLRQDPDVIMVGEIRDAETAQIATQASLTGHLILSTLHTNDAPSSLVRLVDMGVEAFLISSTVRAILSQRLVRKLCNRCKAKKTVRWEDLLKHAFPKASEPLFQGHIYESRGCDACHKTGYSGRIGVYEFMSVSEDLIDSFNANSTASELREIALANGMITLGQDCADKVLLGLTSMEEMFRVHYAAE